MKPVKNFTFLVFVSFSVVLVSSLPTSLIEEVKSNELRENKIKRAHGSLSLSEEDPRQPVPYYSNPTAIKRGASLKNDNLEDQTKEWYQEAMEDSMSQLPSSLYNDDEARMNDKSMSEYEKGFRYATNKDKLNEALENAVLKSELYGEPSAINQYRYYGTGMEEKRRKRNARKLRLENRMKRDVEFTPEDILTLLTLWENERQRSPVAYRNNWQRYEPSYDIDAGDNVENDLEQDDENWLDTPVYPHVAAKAAATPNYYYEEKPPLYEKRSQWGGFGENKKKRFMVARKRNDPTRELHYLTGPVQDRNDFYTLAQLLSQQREPNVPLYHRRVL